MLRRNFPERKPTHACPVSGELMQMLAFYTYVLEVEWPENFPVEKDFRRCNEQRIQERSKEEWEWKQLSM